MPTAQEKIDRYQEIANRGLQDKLTPDKRAVFDEVARRGLIQVEVKPTPDEVEQQRIARLDALPEVMGAGLFEGENSAKLAMITPALMTALDPAEMGQIITNNFPNIGISYSPEGRIIARNNRTGAVGELNKPNLSKVDILQGLGIASAFFPSAQGVGTQVTKAALARLAAQSALTQAGIEGVQAASGGEFNPGQVAVEGLTAPIAQVGVEKVVKPLAKNAFQTGANMAKTTAEAAADKAGQLRQFFQGGDQSLDDVAQAARRGNVANLAEIIQPDPRVYAANEALGMGREIPAGFATQNPQYRDLEMGLASIPGNVIEPEHFAYMDALQQRAGQLLEEAGGSLNRGGLSESYRQEILNMSAKMEKEAFDLWQKVDEMIDPTTPVTANNTIEFLMEKARKLGGVDKLEPAFKKLLTELTPKTQPTKQAFNYATGTKSIEEVLPTVELLSDRRKDVGEAMANRIGIFKNGEAGFLKALYGVMAKDQMAVAEKLGPDVGALAKLANRSVENRKIFEDNAIKLLGKDLKVRSITQVIGGAISGLKKGKLPNFNAQIERIPPSLRQEVVSTSFRDAMSGGGQGGNLLNPTKFTQFMDELALQPEAKRALYQNLPRESRIAIENLYTISKAISKAQAVKRPTGRNIALLLDGNRIMKKLMFAPLKAVGRRAPGGGVIMDVMDKYINQQDGAALAVSELLASEKFQNVLKVAVREGSVEGGQISRQLQKAEAALAKSEAFKNWLQFMDNETLGNISKGGTASITAYLLQDDGE